MAILVSIVWTLAGQLALGALLAVLGSFALGRKGAGRRRRLLVWTGSARALVPAAAGSLAVAAVVALWRAAVGPGLAIDVQPAAGLAPGVPLAGTLATCGCYLILHAGRRERLGKLRAARRLVRFGGNLLFVGIIIQLVLRFATLVRLPRTLVLAALDQTHAPAWVLLLGPTALGFAVFIGLLAGLAGKPRPSALFVTVLYVGGLAALIGSAHAVRNAVLQAV